MILKLSPSLICLSELLGLAIGCSPAKRVLRDISWKEIIFKISAQRFNVYRYMLNGVDIYCIGCLEYR